jgi:hypothetical protein
MTKHERTLTVTQIQKPGNHRRNACIILYTVIKALYYVTFFARPSRSGFQKATEQTNFKHNKMAPKAAIKADRKAAKAERALKPKPKRAPSPYIIFSTEKRPGIKDSHPNASFGETGKILGAMWSAMDEKAKAVCSYLTFRSHSQSLQ